MKFLYYLLVLVPIAFFVEFTHANEVAIFAISALALVPLAAVLGRATEEVAIYTGPKIGALLNATLGNAAELIITLVALRAGLINVVKASIAGSIIGNILIVLGASLLLGGLRHGIQRFDQHTAGVNANMMALAVISLVVPAVFALGHEDIRPTFEDTQLISDGLAIVLILVYILYVFYTLRGHAGDPGTPPAPEHHDETPSMKLPMALGVLALATLLIVFMSEFLVGAIEPTAEKLGLSDLFIGVMLVPLVGNVAEHLVAVQVALQNKMDLSLGIAIGSSLQVALFVAPILVLAGVVMGQPMNLVFNGYEMGAMVGATFIAVLISLDGESNWLEGVQLIALYLMLGIAFFFVG